MATVLNTGTEKTLLAARAAALQQGGHAVVSVMNEIDLLDACKRNHFDVTVIGQMTATMPKHRIVALLRGYCPKTLVLELHTVKAGKTLKHADDWLQVSPDTVGEELAERVTVFRNGVPLAVALHNAVPGGKLTKSEPRHPWKANTTV